MMTLQNEVGFYPSNNDNQNPKETLLPSPDKIRTGVLTKQHPHELHSRNFKV